MHKHLHANPPLLFRCSSTMGSSSCPIKHCPPNGLFAFQAANFFCRCGTSASKLLFPGFPHKCILKARAPQPDKEREPLLTAKADFGRCINQAVSFTKKPVNPPPHPSLKLKAHSRVTLWPCFAVAVCALLPPALWKELLAQPLRAGLTSGRTPVTLAKIWHIKTHISCVPNWVLRIVYSTNNL